MPLALYPFLLFLLGILEKRFRFHSFKTEVLPHLLYILVLSQHFPQFATMRCLFHHCLPLPRLQWHLALCRQPFVVTLLIQVDRVGFLTLIDNNRSKLPESEGLVTALIVASRPRGMLSALHTKLVSSASSWLKFNESLTSSCVSSDSTRITFLFGL